MDHYPEEKKWQLRSPEITHGDFMRAPQLRPRFYASGLKLISPDRSQVTVSGAADVQVELPAARPMFLLADWESGGRRERCNVDGAKSVNIRCSFPVNGTYRILLFESEEPFGRYDFVGELIAIDHP